LDVTTALQQIDTAASRRQLSPGACKNLKRWLAEPQYGRYLPRLLPLIAGEKFDELDALFWEVIPFGTGGRRGLMAELGSATMNERTVAESAHGLAVYLKQQRGAAGGSGVVAYDTRNRSREFAELTATTLAAHGLKVFLFESHRSTPELSFAVRHLTCDVGVMITASHNPPSDNGFKAYWSNGAQVLSPHDRGIINCVYEAGEIPAIDFRQAVGEGRIELVGDAVDRAFLEEVTRLSLSSAREIKALYSPLHGVGETSLYRSVLQAGFRDVEVYEPQRRPDGNFTNVPDRLPNPERPQVFAPLIEHAKRSGAEVILASDPDADRLGVAARGRDGEFVYLTGNRVGALLADYIVRKRAAARTLSSAHYVIETLVTSRLTGAVARAAGLRVFDDLLVGFKYIAETMDREGPDKFVFATEESLGYLAGIYCRDKDASIAALYLLEAAAELRLQGKTLLDRLEELFLEHGYYLEDQRSEVCTGSRGKEQIDALMRAFRTTPPTELAGIRLARVRDYNTHEVRDLPGNKKSADLPKPHGDLVFFDSVAGECTVSVAVRPSGTEPKIKFYFFAHAPNQPGVALQELKRRTERKLLEVQDALSAWVRNVLTSEGR
jgi:phosphoglucomutase/phosphomannomutase